MVEVEFRGLTVVVGRALPVDLSKFGSLSIFVRYYYRQERLTDSFVDTVERGSSPKSRFGTRFQVSGSVLHVAKFWKMFGRPQNSMYTVRRSKSICSANQMFDYCIC
jgi:hypothetical protein